MWWTHKVWWIHTSNILVLYMVDTNSLLSATNLTTVPHAAAILSAHDMVSRWCLENSLFFVCVVFLRRCYFWIFFGAVHPCRRFLFWVLCWWPTGSHSLSLAAWHKTQTPTNLQNHPPPRWNLCATLAALAMRVRLSAFRTGPSSTGSTIARWEIIAN